VDGRLGDHVLEDGDEQLVLPAEVPIEGLQRDAGLLHQLLRREAPALLGDQAARGVDDHLGVLDAAGPRPLHGRRAVGGPLGPRLGRHAHVGVSTTTGITRSVRVW
jgi:hypothetical protein